MLSHKRGERATWSENESRARCILSLSLSPSPSPAPSRSLLLIFFLFHPPLAARDMEAPAGANGGEGPSERVVVEESARLADRARELHDAAAALTSRTSADEQSLRARVLALESDLRRLRSTLSTAIKNREINPTVAEKVAEFQSWCFI